MSEILRGGNSHLEGTWDKRGIIPKTRMLLTALAASTMLMGGPQASAQTQTTEDGKARIEMREKQENQEPFLFLGNEEIERYFKKHDKIPTIPNGITIGKNEIEKVLQQGSPDPIRGNIIFVANSNNNSFIIDTTGIEIWSAPEGNVTRNGKYLIIKGWAQIDMKVNGELVDFVVNTSGNIVKEDSDGNIEELGGGEHTVIIDNNGIDPNIIKQKLGDKSFIEPSDKIGIPELSDAIVGFRYFNGTDYQYTEGRNKRESKTLMEFISENNIPNYEITSHIMEINGVEYRAKVKKYKLRTATGDGNTGHPSLNGGNNRGPEMTFAFVSLETETTIPEITVNGPGELILQDENGNPIGDNNLQIGKKYQAYPKANEACSLKEFTIDGQKQTTIPAEFTANKNTTIYVRFEKIETPINKITPSIEIKNPEMGSISLLNEKNEEVSELEEGKKYTVNVSANEGSEIQSIVYNGEEQKVSDKKNFSLQFVAQDSCSFKVHFEKEAPKQAPAHIELPAYLPKDAVQFSIQHPDGTVNTIDSDTLKTLPVGGLFSINIARPVVEADGKTYHFDSVTVNGASSKELIQKFEVLEGGLNIQIKYALEDNIETISPETLRIATQPGKLILSTQRPQAVQVYDMNGTLKYYNRTLEEEHLNLPTGAYIIKTEQGSQKVIIP